jgi:hypothetical protein
LNGKSEVSIRITDNNMSSANAEVIWREFGENCNLYEIFGVEKTATEKEITRAYRKLALRYVSALKHRCLKKWNALRSCFFLFDICSTQTRIVAVKRNMRMQLLNSKQSVQFTLS